MSERLLTDEQYRAWIDAGSPNELEGWAIILALRARVAKLEEELEESRSRNAKLERHLTELQMQDFAQANPLSLALRARVAQLEAALTKIRDNDPDGWEAAIARAALKDAPQ